MSTCNFKAISALKAEKNTKKVLLNLPLYVLAVTCFSASREVLFGSKSGSAIKISSLLDYSLITILNITSRSASFAKLINF